MSGLAGLQQGFQDSILSEKNRLGERIVGSDRVSADVRLGLYSDAYRLRLIEVLGDNFPTLHTLLGDEEFDRCARAYISAHTPSHYSVRWFGNRLADFLAGGQPYAGQPVLAEMAQFEWALRSAFDAADSKTIAVEDVAAVPPESWAGMRIELHPSVQRIDLGWNVPGLWKTIDEGNDPDPPVQADYPQGWVIWRRDLRQFFRSLDVAEAWALDAVLQGESFAGLCEGLCEWVDPASTPLHAAGLLKTWVSEQMVARLDIDN
jgi:hypothetical protein